MVRAVDCHAGVLGSNPCRPKRFSPWNYFNGGSDNSVMPESASGAVAGYTVGTVDARLPRNKRGKSVLTVPFLTALLLGWVNSLAT